MALRELAFQYQLDEGYMWRRSQAEPSPGLQPSLVNQRISAALLDPPLFLPALYVAVNGIREKGEPAPRTGCGGRAQSRTPVLIPLRFSESMSCQNPK